MVRSIGKTMVQGKNYGPQITVKRISTRWVLHNPSPRFSCHLRRPSSYVCRCSRKLIHTISVALCAIHSVRLPLPAKTAHLLRVEPDAFPLLFLSCRGRKCKPIFVQIARQVVKLNASDLRLPSRAWKVKLVGEGADDAGGVFDDTITEMCQVTAAAFPSAGHVTPWLFD